MRDATPPHKTVIEAADITPAPSYPCAMLYTLLRHGRNLSHAQASRQLERHVSAPDEAA